MIYIELTLARQGSLMPRVIKVGVAFISALVEPSTIASTTIELAIFCADAALGTRDRSNNKQGDRC